MEDAIIKLLKDKLRLGLNFSNNVLTVSLTVDCDGHYANDNEWTNEILIAENEIDLTDINPGMDYI